MLRTRSLTDFLDVLASDAPAPGGGSVAALNGALAAGLVEMVCRLSVNRPELEARQTTLAGLSEHLILQRRELLGLVDEDTDAFSAVMRAFKLPKDTEEAKKARSAAIQEGYKEAVAVPLRTARLCAAVAAHGAETAEGFNPNTASDLGTALECAAAGLHGAAMNVRINLPSIKDEAYVQDVSRELEALERVLEEARARVAVRLGEGAC